jgi:hypothetical protein
LGFIGLATETVPVSTTETITETGTSYSPYVETNVVPYTSTSFFFETYTTAVVTPIGNGAACGWPPCYPPLVVAIVTNLAEVFGTQTFQSTNEAPMTSTVPFWFKLPYTYHLVNSGGYIFRKWARLVPVVSQMAPYVI